LGVEGRDVSARHVGGKKLLAPSFFYNPSGNLLHMLSPNDLSALIIKMRVLAHLSIIGGQADWGKPWDL